MATLGTFGQIYTFLNAQLARFQTIFSFNRLAHRNSSYRINTFRVELFNTPLITHQIDHKFVGSTHSMANDNT